MMSHDELQFDLAAHLSSDARRMVWTNIPCGPVGSPRPDCYTMQKSYIKPMPMAYDVKRTVSDFRSDVTSGKWHNYLSFAEGVYFATPAGLINKSDVPPHAGWIVRHDKVWRVAKRAPLTPVVLPSDLLLKLLMEGQERQFSSPLLERFDRWRIDKKLCEKYGETVARVVRDVEAAERHAKNTEEKAAEIQKKARAEAGLIELRYEVEEFRSFAVNVLGLPEDSNWGTIGWKYRQKMSEAQIDHRIEKAIAAAEKAREQTDHILEILRTERSGT